MKRSFTLTLILIFIGGIAQAQDKIIRKNPTDTIVCNVVEIGDILIKYTSEEFSKEVVFTINKNYITKIVFKNGSEMNFSGTKSVEPQKSSAHYDSQRKNALKLSLTSPILGASIFSFERSIKPTQSFEIGFGVIGLGIDTKESDPTGIIIKAGYKFKFSPSHYDNRGKYGHILKGAYLKPELTFVRYNETQFDYYYYDYASDIGRHRDNYNISNTMISAIMIGGKQWVIGDRLVLDAFVGMGFGFGSNNNDESWHYGFLGAADNVPLVFTSGFKLGILF